MLNWDFECTLTAIYTPPTVGPILVICHVLLVNWIMYPNRIYAAPPVSLTTSWAERRGDQEEGKDDFINPLWNGSIAPLNPFNPRFPRYWLQRKPLVSDPDMPHGTCVTLHAACTTRNFTYLVRDPWWAACVPSTVATDALVLKQCTRPSVSMHCADFLVIVSRKTGRLS